MRVDPIWFVVLCTLCGVLGMVVGWMTGVAEGRTRQKEADAFARLDRITAGVMAADNWQQYAKDGETAQACIERHRREGNALLKLLAQAREPLTDEQIIALLPAGWTGMLAQVMEFARRIEAARGVPACLPEHLREDAPHLLYCTFCGRKSWTEAEFGKHCNMPQPDGSRCVGTMIRPSGVPGTEAPSKGGSDGR